MSSKFKFIANCIYKRTKIYIKSIISNSYVTKYLYEYYPLKIKQN